MKSAVFLCAATVLVLSAGCASSPDTPELQIAPEREYQTGSNIPRREKRAEAVKTIDPADVRRDSPSAGPSRGG